MLFAIQMFWPRDLAMAWLPLVRELVTNAPGRHRPEAMAALLRDLCGLLSAALPDAQFGLWEYVEDPEQASEDYQSWCEGTVIDVDEESEHADPEEDAYAFVTLLLLLEDGGEAQARIWSASERIPDGEEASRRAYERWLDLIPSLDFRTVESTAIFVRPGAEGLGVMAPMLAEEHYHHLVPLIG